MAVLEKLKPLPWEVQTKRDTLENLNGTEADVEKILISEKKRPKKRIKLGYKEDPFVFFGDNEEIWNSVRYCVSTTVSFISPFF